MSNQVDSWPIHNNIPPSKHPTEVGWLIKREPHLSADHQWNHQCYTRMHAEVRVCVCLYIKEKTEESLTFYFFIIKRRILVKVKTFPSCGLNCILCGCKNKTF